jgi:hypothetical protein
MTDSSNPTRRRLLLGIGVAATASLAGCSATTDEDDDTTTAPDGSGTDTPTPDDTDGSASLRVAHLSPNAPNVDVYVDGTAVLEDVPFGAVSTYLDVPAGSRLVRISPAGDMDTVVFEGDVPVAADGVYTVAAIGEIGETVQQSFEPLVLEDDNSDPDAETARLRVVHASPDAPAVDVTVAGADGALFDGVGYGQSGYVTVPAGEYTVQIRGDTETNDGDVVASFDLSLGAGGVYTAFAGGYLSPDDEGADTPFDLFVAQDAGETMAMDPASLRVAHLSPNAPNVDVYVDGTAVLEDVPFGAVSNYLTVPAGAHQVAITAAGDPDTVVFDEELTVAAGTHYTAAAVGELGDMADRSFEVRVLEDDVTLPGDGMAKLRLVHTSPDAPAVDVTVESTGDVLYDGVAFGESGYVTVPEGAYTIEVRGDTMANDGDVVTTFDVDLAGETVYTAFAGGYLSPDDEPGDAMFDLFVAVDA